MTRFSVPYEEMEIIKIIIRVPSSLSSLFLFLQTRTCLCSLSVKLILFM